MTVVYLTSCTVFGADRERKLSGPVHSKNADDFIIRLPTGEEGSRVLLLFIK